jgi:Tfp pilus assembly protein PilF
MEMPGDPEAYVILGEVAIAENRVTEADLLYAQAAKTLADFKGNAKRKDQLQPRILGGEARVAEARADWTKAQKLLEDLLKIDAKNAGAMEQLAQVLFKQKDAPGAFKMLQKAKETDATVMQPEAQLAMLYERYPDRDNAKKWMAAALKAAPKDLATHIVAARWALQAGMVPEAKEYASDALKIDPKSLEAKILRGVVALFQKDPKGAELYFEEAHLQSPARIDASNNLALALVEQDDEAKKQRALQYAQNNYQQYPKSAETASTYGWVLYRVGGHLDDADKMLRLAASAGIPGADTAYYIARVAIDKGRPEEAKSLLKAALDSKQPFPQRDDAEAWLSKLDKASGEKAAAEKAGGEKKPAASGAAKPAAGK